jgi:hypothetical protein
VAAATETFRPGRDHMSGHALAAMLGIPEAELLAIAQANRLPFEMVDGVFRVRRVDLGSWIESVATSRE